ncbi:MAG: hypothetical protein HYV60_19315 [Planctomycetia bacterium]|nr:hypothetical protein [Planctomycetia bacterium]
MPDERDKSSDEEIRDLLRDIRDGQRELVEMAKEDRERWKTQLEELEKWQVPPADGQPQTDPDVELWRQANHKYIEYFEEVKRSRTTGVVTVIAVAILIVCVIVASSTGWFD